MGGQRCGTNSLYEYLVKHPDVGRALPNQEVHYFDLNFSKGLEWYQGHFPLRVRVGPNRRSRPPLISGECSPYYMFHPLAPHRIAEVLPTVKLFVLLRNPVDRAYSHYQHERARGFETLSFEEAIEREPERLSGEVLKIESDPNFNSFNHQRFSYLARGMYTEQVERLFSLFPRERILILGSERLFADPAGVREDAIRFLGLPTHHLGTYPHYNPGRYTNMDPQMRHRLMEHFADSNERLYQLAGIDFRWE
jgi:Sulfotransferase domain